jgi:hypothetical protein
MKDLIILGLLTGLLLISGSGISAFGDSIEIPVTPDALNQGDYVFSVTTNSVQDGVAFHVIITSKRYDILPDSGAHVDMVIHKQIANGGIEESIGPVKPGIPISLKKENRVWTVDFTITREVLKNPEASFVFSVLGQLTVNGKVIEMPSVTFYELRLQDFAKL